MKDNPFADLIPAQSGAAPAAAGAVPPMRLVVPKPADQPPARNAEAIVVDQNQANASAYAVPKAAADTEQAQYRAETDPIYNRTNAITPIRSAIRSDPRIVNYETTVPVWASALRAPPTAEGDALLVNSAAKLFDPTTGVLSGEYATYANNQPTIEAYQAKLGKQLGLDEGGLFTEAGRARLRAAMTTRMRELATGYNAARDYWGRQIEVSRIPDLKPEDLLGEHFGARYQQPEADYLGRPVRNLDGSQGAVPVGQPRVPQDGQERDIGFAGRGNNSEVVPIDPKAVQGWHGFLAGFDKGELTPNLALKAWERITGRPADPVQMEKVVAHFNKTGEWSTDIVYRDPADISDVRGVEGEGLDESMDAGARGVADTLTLGALPRIRALAGSLGGDGTYRENLARERAIDEYDTENNFAERSVGQVAGGFMIPTGAATAARGAAVAVIRRGGSRAEALAAGRAAATRRISMEGTGFGAAYGAGSSDGDLVSLEALVDSAIGATVGAVAGQAVGRGSGALAARAEPGREMQRVANRLGVQSTPSTRGGDAAFVSQMALGNVPGSAGFVRSGVRAENDTLGEAARRVADRLGPVTNRNEAGERLARGAAAYDRLTSAQGANLYRRRDQLMGGPDTEVPLDEAVTALNQFARDFPSSPLLESILIHPAIRRVAGVASETAVGPNGPQRPALTLRETTEALSFTRTQLRNLRAQNRTTTQEERRLTQFENALERDVMNLAAQADAAAGRTGADTAQAAQRAADRFWATKKLVTDRSMRTASNSNRDNIGTNAEKVFGELAGDMRRRGGNMERLQTNWRNLPTRARREFAATLYDDLGRATDGNNNAAGTDWSFGTFLTNWNSLDPAARRMVFGGRGVEREIEDIANYASRLREMGRSNNFSNTAMHTLAGAYALTIGSSIWEGDFAGAAKKAAAVPAGMVAGAMFMRNPNGRRWLRDTLGAMIRGDESHLARQTRRLSVLARQEPVIAADALDLQERIRGTAGDAKPAPRPAKP